MTRCPQSSQLQQLCGGHLSPAEQETLAAHVEECASCQQLLARWNEETGSYLPQASSALESAPPTLPADFLQRLKDNPPAPEPPREPPDVLFEAPTPRGPLGRLGAYHIVSKLGEGAFAVVYAAWDEHLDQLVAVKVLKRERAARAEDRARFEREARRTAAVKDEHIVTIRHVGHTPGFPLPYLVMEYIEGETLTGRLKRQGALKPQEAAAIARQVALGLAAAHAHGQVHRDIKPDNIMLDHRSGRARITDFGLARRIEATATRVTQAGALIGTPAYMSPEQVQSAETLDGRSDVYSLGVVLYELLTGRLPFRGTSSFELLRQVVHEEPVSPRAIDPGLPHDLDTITLKCLAKKPSERYPDARSLAEDLQCYLNGEALCHARPVGWRERAWRWCRRNPALAVTAGLAAALLAVTLLTLSVAVLLVGRSRDQEQQQRRRAEHRLAENYLDLGVWSGYREEYGRGLLYLVRALEVCPADATDLQEQIRLGLGRFALAATELKLVLQHPPEFPVAKVAAAALSPDGTVVLTAGEEGAVWRWDASTGQPLGEPLAHPNRVRALAFSPDGKWYVTGCDDGKARVWEGTSREPRLTLSHKGAVTAVAFSPGSGTVATGAEDGLVRLWQLPGGEPLAVPLAHGAAIRALAFSPDGRALVTGGTDKAARRWVAATGERLGRTLDHSAAVLAATYSPDGGEILTGCEDCKARFWLLREERFVDFALSHPDVVQAVAYSPDGKTVLTGCSNHQGQLWERATGRAVGETLQDFSEGRGVAFSRDGRTILTCSLNGTRLWTRSQPLVLRHGPWQWVAAVAFSPDGRRLLSGSGDIRWRRGQTRLWDARTGKPLGPAAAHRYMVMSVAFSPDGSRFATGSGNFSEVETWFGPLFGPPAGEAQVWDAVTGERVGPALPHKGSVPAVAFRPGDGRYLLTACMQGQTACLWEAATGKLVRSLPHRSRVVAVAFSSDGTRLATGQYGDDERVLLWEAATGTCCGQLQHHSIVPGLAFSLDGRSLLTGSGGYVASLWDLDHPEQPRQTFAHRQWIRAVAFHPRDPRLILTGSGDNTARLWDVETGKQVGPPLRHEGMVLSAAFSPDGTAVATGSQDGTVHIWKLPPTVAGEVARIKLWAQVITGLELDGHDVPHAIDARAWHHYRDELQKLGGPPVL
jgi:WD40 repeat protein/tRNA A-37 threonylcarbamoyl transferase component Bud32